MNSILNDEWNWKMSIVDKIKIIKTNSDNLCLVGPINLPINLFGSTVVFKWYCWLKVNELMMDPKEIISQLSSMDLAESQQSSVLVYGDFTNAEDALIRFHSICHTGDIFGSKRCDCGFQLKESMKTIVEHGHGALFYLSNHEGRGIGLFSKAIAYLIQENGLDTVDANLMLGFEDDTRNYTDAITILKSLREKPVTVMTNNPNKLRALQNAGLTVNDLMPIWGDISLHNEKYLLTKMNRSGHLHHDKLLSITKNMSRNSADMTNCEEIES